MEVIKKYWAIIPIFVLLVYSYIQDKKRLNMENQIRQEHADFGLLKDRWKEADTTVKIQAQQIASKNDVIYKLAKQNSQLTNLNAQIRTGIKTRIDSVFIPFSSDTTQLGEKKDSIAVPQTFHKKDANGWYEMAGQVQKKGILIDSLDSRADVQVTIGSKKEPGFKNILKKKRPVVEVISNSPYVTITGVSNVIFKDEGCTSCKYKHLIAGAIIGAALALALF